MKSYYLLKEKQGFLINIERKKVKNYNIRILPDNKINCSVPIDCSDEDISKFLKEKENWIFKHNIKQVKLQAIQNKNILKQGGCVKILGHSYMVNIKNAKQNNIELNDKEIIFYIKNSCCNLEKKYEEFSRIEMKNVYQNILDKYYPIIRKHGKIKPNINIRKMKQCWGTSNPENNTITINEYLYMAPKYCIEYVILHEITHFLYPFHNKSFYNFISVHMPDWQDRKKKLNIEFSV